MEKQQGALPDAGLIFDTIFKRREAKQHPNKISSVLFYFATIIIHDLFRTSHDDPNISTTSSYLDLSPLYGNSQEEQNDMRTHKDGRIKPDCFAEKRIHGFPPGVSVLLIMFNRFHNHVVENLAAINEGDRFSKSSKTRDEDLFQTGRLITCGLYVNIILNDYIRVIVNLIRTKSKWKIDPRKEIKGGPPRGIGNAVSAEFNLIYRWHAVVSERDAEWIEKTYTKVFGRSPSKLSVVKMIQELNDMEKKHSKKSPDEQPLLNQNSEPIPRDPRTGRLDDDELVKILTESTEDCANAFGANQVPECLRVVEVMSIEQARKWQTCTLNEFRKFFSLQEYKTFEEINPDIAGDLAFLYESPDQVELYPGLICESTKKEVRPGSGLMPGYTISRAILSDAVALVRGDRFHTVDYNRGRLTAWGFAEADSISSIDYGCCFYKLFYTSFPNHYKRDSVYAHFPLMTPKEMMKIMNKLEPGKHSYNDDKPERQPRQVEITTFSGAQYILKNKHIFGVSWTEAMEFMMGPSAKNFMLAGDDEPNQESRKLMHAAVYPQHSDWHKEIHDFYMSKTQSLLEEKKHKFRNLPGKNMVDLIYDVTNIVHVHFCCEMFFIPLVKSDEKRLAPFTEQGMYLVFFAVFVCVFFDVDPQHSFQIHKEAKNAAKLLGKALETNAKSIRDRNTLSAFMQYFVSRKEKSKLGLYGENMIQRILKSRPDLSTKEIVWGHILGTAGGMVPNQGQQFAEMLDFYLFHPDKKHWRDIVKTAKEPESEETNERLLRYVMEGCRLACASAVSRTVRTNYANIPEYAGLVDPDSTERERSEDGKTKLHKDEKVFVNLWAASRDPEHYKNPEKVDLTRDLDKDYVCFGWGQHECLGLDVVKISLTCILRVVARLPNLRPADGPEGRMKKIPANVGLPPGTAKGYYKYLTKAYDSYFPFPLSMKVIWDDPGTPESVPLANGVNINEEVINNEEPIDVQVNGESVNGGLNIGYDVHGEHDRSTAHVNRDLRNGVEVNGVDGVHAESSIDIEMNGGTHEEEKASHRQKRPATSKATANTKKRKAEGSTRGRRTKARH